MYHMVELSNLLTQCISVFHVTLTITATLFPIHGVNILSFVMEETMHSPVFTVMISPQ